MGSKKEATRQGNESLCLKHHLRSLWGKRRGSRSGTFPLILGNLPTLAFQLPRVHGRALVLGFSGLCQPPGERRAAARLFGQLHALLARVRRARRSCCPSAGVLPVASTATEAEVSASDVRLSCPTGNKKFFCCSEKHTQLLPPTPGTTHINGSIPEPRPQQRWAPAQLAGGWLWQQTSTQPCLEIALKHGTVLPSYRAGFAGSRPQNFPTGLWAVELMTTPHKVRGRKYRCCLEYYALRSGSSPLGIHSLSFGLSSQVCFCSSQENMSSL